MKDVIPANLFRGKEAVGGHLHFKESEMIFKSHSFNVQTGDTSIPYKDIANVQTRNTLGLVPNGMLVTLKNGTEYKFVIWNRNEIISFLKRSVF